MRAMPDDLEESSLMLFGSTEVPTVRDDSEMQTYGQGCWMSLALPWADDLEALMHIRYCIDAD